MRRHSMVTGAWLFWRPSGQTSGTAASIICRASSYVSCSFSACLSNWNSTRAFRRPWTSSARRTAQMSVHWLIEWLYNHQLPACTFHLVHGGDDLTQGVHQRSVLHRASFLQTELLSLCFPPVLWWSPAGRASTWNQKPDLSHPSHRLLFQVFLTRRCGSYSGSIWSRSSHCWPLSTVQHLDSLHRRHLREETEGYSKV